MLLPCHRLSNFKVGNLDASRTHRKNWTFLLRYISDLSEDETVPFAVVKKRHAWEVPRGDSC